ncbi:MAG TPA: hypothetical protein VJK04_01690 [Candidatus Paceibacterota bacterium]
MTESTWEELQRLKEESRQFQEKRRVFYYEHETPGFLDEHNRQIRIARLSEQPYPPEC